MNSRIGVITFAGFTTFFAGTGLYYITGPTTNSSIPPGFTEIKSNLLNGGNDLQKLTLSINVTLPDGTTITKNISQIKTDLQGAAGLLEGIASHLH